MLIQSPFKTKKINRHYIHRSTRDSDNVNGGVLRVHFSLHRSIANIPNVTMIVLEIPILFIALIYFFHCEM